MSETPDDQVHTERLHEQEGEDRERANDDELGRGGALGRLGADDDGADDAA